MVQRGRTRSFDGTRIAYRVTGTGDPTIVLSNGIGCHRVFFRHLVRDLSRRYRVITYDYRGHGDSEAPPAPSAATVDGCVRDLEAVLDATWTDRAVLGGYSFGVQVSLEAYARRPDRALGLVLVSGTHERAASTLKTVGPVVGLSLPLLEALAVHQPWLLGPVWRTLLTNRWSFSLGSLLGMYDAGLERSDFAGFTRHFAGLDLAMFAHLARSMNRESAAAVLPRVHVPTLVVSGDRDTFTPPPVVRRMVERLPGAEHAIVEGGTHAAILEKPRAVNDVVLSFMERRIVPLSELFRATDAEFDGATGIAEHDADGLAAGADVLRSPSIGTGEGRRCTRRAKRA
jgi:pimeloyl-ACP methyl ester carboxylesterase